MSLTQLQALQLPRPLSRLLKRRFLVAKKQTQKLYKSNLRKAKSAIRAYVRSHYFMSQAFVDLRISAKRNEDIFLGSLMFVWFLGFSVSATLANLVFIFLQTAYELGDITGTNLVPLMIWACTVLAVFGAWVAAFLVNTMTISIMEGANRKINRSIKRTFRKSLLFSARVASAWALLGLMIAGPFLLAAVPALVFILLNDVTLFELIAGLEIAGIVAAVWIPIILMQYSLLPYVVLFEPSLGFKKSLSCSRQLVLHKGRIFVLSTYIVVGLILMIAYKFFGLVENLIGLNQWLSFSMFAIAVGLVANGLMVMLYRKRKLARKN